MLDQVRAIDKGKMQGLAVRIAYYVWGRDFDKETEIDNSVDPFEGL